MTKNVKIAIDLLKITLGGMSPSTADEVVKTVIKLLEEEK